ncbi:MAG: TonB-dependent receptor, partial [Pseudomonadales bacterium]
GIFSPTLDVLYNSGYETVSTQDSDVAQDKYFQFNGRLELSDFDGAWTVALTGENLTNEKIVGTAAPVPVANGLASQRAYIGFIRPPRSIGLNVRYNFF